MTGRRKISGWLAAIAQVRAELDRFKTEWKGRQDDDLGWGARREGKESGVTPQGADLDDGLSRWRGDEPESGIQEGEGGEWARDCYNSSWDC